ncbi:hypothetical protein OG906_41385 (plasmid) [Streptomyces sp. NBC_01426]|uniref:hypothetical protein n=1 Tax=Streptomyces sp. NBC_01426 TaxID=2975866 RepID=UPI002E324B04|nr:hypothetical protein [Streptomyces sp. NBC_01426]
MVEDLAGIRGVGEDLDAGGLQVAGARDLRVPDALLPQQRQDVVLDVGDRVGKLLRSLARSVLLQICVAGSGYRKCHPFGWTMVVAVPA